MKLTLNEKFNILKNFVESIEKDKIYYNGSTLCLSEILDIDNYTQYDMCKQTLMNLRDAAWKVLSEITD